jgi:hypothetical protein
MKNEQKNCSINDQLPCVTVSALVKDENIAQMSHAKSLKDIAAQQKKKDASEPLYLVRYE